MIDPPANEEKAVSVCIQAGIIPVMITATTNSQQKAIAKQLHNHLRQRRYLEWNKMAALSEKSFQIVVACLCVSTLNKKLKIIKALQSKDQFCSDDR
jgi:Ca2+-transporting ATPase